MCNQCLGIFSPSASACDIQGWIGNINGGEDNMPLINWLRKVKRLKVSSFDLRLRRALSLTPNVNSNWFLHRAVPDKHFYSTAPISVRCKHHGIPAQHFIISDGSPPAESRESPIWDEAFSYIKGARPEKYPGSRIRRSYRFVPLSRSIKIRPKRSASSPSSAGFLPLIPRPPTHFPFPSKRGMPPSSVVKAGSQKSAIVIRSLNSLSWKSFVELSMRKAV